MSIDAQVVRHVARLANLKLQDEEIDRLTGELGAILRYVDQLSQLDTSDVPPTTCMLVEQAPLRSDEAEASLSPKAAVDQGPRVQDNAFSVPTFVEE